MSNRKAITSGFSDDVFSYYGSPPEYSTVGKAYDYIPLKTTYKGDKFYIREGSYYYKSRKSWNGLPYLKGGLCISVLDAHYLEPGNLVVYAYYGGDYGPSGTDRLGVITEITDRVYRVGLVKCPDTGDERMVAKSTVNIKVRSVTKDLKLGSVFEYYSFNGHYNRPTISGSVDVTDKIKTVPRISEAWERDCAMKHNIKKNLDFAKKYFKCKQCEENN